MLRIKELENKKQMKAQISTKIGIMMMMLEIIEIVNGQKSRKNFCFHEIRKFNKLLTKLQQPTNDSNKLK